MQARLKHVAISSNENERAREFYEVLFGMKRDNGNVITDGYIGMNVNGRGAGRQAGLDHFGFEVDDVQQIFANVEDNWPTVHYLKRPASRPFAALGMHDPAGNVFDLSQAGMENRRGVYADAPGVERRHPRHITHLVLRAVDPVAVAAFYQDVLGLREEPKATDDLNTYLSDGSVTFIIAPWRIADFAGTGIERPALDHIGFEVESIEAFKADLDRLVATEPRLAPRALRSEEGAIRLSLLSTCRYGQLQLVDPDGVLLDVSEVRR